MLLPFCRFIQGEEEGEEEEEEEDRIACEEKPFVSSLALLLP